MTRRILTLGVDLGGTKIMAAVVDARGNILGRAKKKTRADLGGDTVLERVARTALVALDDAGVQRGDISAIGIGTPGPIDSDTGVVFEAPNLGWKNVNLKATIEAELGITTRAFNDVNAGTWGEYRLGAGHGARSCLGVFVGTGIGGGIVIDGRLFEGAGHVAGEIGHICLNPHGPRCGCGRKGCLEALASRTAIAREIWKAARKGVKTTVLDRNTKPGSQIRSSRIKQAYENRDRLVVPVVDAAAENLGIGLASVANLLNPERIILGGGVVEALGALYINKVRAAFNARAFESVVDSTELVAASLGDDGGVLGAALLVREFLRANHEEEN